MACSECARHLAEIERLIMTHEEERKLYLEEIRLRDAELAALRAAVRKYGKHLDACELTEIGADEPVDVYTCTCGLEEAPKPPEARFEEFLIATALFVLIVFWPDAFNRLFAKLEEILKEPA